MYQQCDSLDAYAYVRVMDNKVLRRIVVVVSRL